jgi:hypothetical protein
VQNVSKLQALNATMLLWDDITWSTCSVQRHIRAAGTGSNCCAEPTYACSTSAAYIGRADVKTQPTY